MIQGFKEFISKGNAIDLAVGMVIGAAFTAVITALVEKVINPLVGGLFGQPNFDAVGQFTIGEAVVQPGAILTALVNLLLVGAALYFFIIVPMNKLNELKADKAEEEEEIGEDIQLLREIRDSLAR
ncbi:MAG: large conductance mechanosensitive channel protein MscL [Actinomycetaceae bacterium]|nr:large conductance mechanosensitive channel protein MscL [Actinomycetaceae bacterium]